MCCNESRNTDRVQQLDHRAQTIHYTSWRNQRVMATGTLTLDVKYILYVMCTPYN